MLVTCGRRTRAAGSYGRRSEQKSGACSRFFEQGGTAESCVSKTLFSCRDYHKNKRNPPGSFYFSSHCAGLRTRRVRPFKEASKKEELILLFSSDAERKGFAKQNRLPLSPPLRDSVLPPRLPENKRSHVWIVLFLAERSGMANPAATTKNDFIIPLDIITVELRRF